jgi:SAM-dependent methyltransferase
MTDGPTADELHQALLTTFRKQCTAAWRVTLPAIPSLIDEYIIIWEDMLKPDGWAGAHRDELRAELEKKVNEAFAATPRARIILDWETGSNRLDISSRMQTIAENYDRWMDNRGIAPFGSHADARVWLLAEELTERRRGVRVLDIGAGTGRNTLALARHGYLVDAVELSAKFAAQILSNAAAWEIPNVRVLGCDVFATTELRDDYKLIFASEVVTDFRSPAQLHALFELAAKRLLPGGVLLFSVFVTRDGYIPTPTARQVAEHSMSGFFTPDEIADAAAGLPVELIAEDSVYDYEKAHLPADAWPPTTWYISWATGRDVFRSLQGEPPIELRWLAYRRVY